MTLPPDAPNAGQAAFEQLGPDVWAAIQGGGGWFVGNSGWLEGPDRTLVVDAFVSERRTRVLIEGFTERRRHTGAVSIVITHEHGDHANGACLFEDYGAQVLASDFTIDAFQTSGVHSYPGYLTTPQWGDVRPPRAMTPVNGRRDVDLGDGRVAVILQVPMTAHTPGDLVVWSPEDRVLFCGDLIFNEVTPLAISGSVDGWLAALTWMEALEPETIVPGHGPVCDLSAVRLARQYLSWCQASAVRISRGEELASCLRDKPETWIGLGCEERDVPNLMRAVADLTGQPFDFVAAMDAMIAAKGSMIAAPY